jgi:hypothetical protein
MFQLYRGYADRDLRNIRPNVWNAARLKTRRMLLMICPL